MIRILGFEGVVRDALIAYGAAAVQLPDGTILNSFTRHRHLADELDPTEAVTLFERPWELDDEELAAHPLVVVAIKLHGAPSFVEELLPDTQRLAGYVKKEREKPYVYILLRDRDAFSYYADDTAVQCTNAVMRETWSGQDALGLIRCALTLRPRDPSLLALRVHLSSGSQNMRRTAERLLEGASEADRQLFHTILDAAQNSTNGAMYIVRYDDGDQQLGGFDLNDAVTQFAAFDGLHESLLPSMLQRLPFLEDVTAIPRNRLQHFETGSAEIGLGVLGKNLQERIVRYVELQMLANVLRGNVPDALAHDGGFVENLGRILNPPGGATLQHRPIGADRLEPVAVDLPDADDDGLMYERQFRLIGYVQGFFDEVKRAEVRLSPFHTVLVSVSDDGTQHIPIGAEMLQSGSGVFQPAVFALLRHQMHSGRQRWFLQRMTLLAVEPQQVDSVASSIVPKGLFVPPEPLNATFQNQLMTVGLAQVRIYNRNLSSSLEWIRSWQQDALEQELQAAKDPRSEWYPPGGFGQGIGMTPLMRVILTLGAAPEGARVDQLVQSLNGRFNVTMRVRHARRVVRASTLGLFEENEDEDIIRLSALGVRWYRVLDRFFQVATTR